MLEVETSCQTINGLHRVCCVIENQCTFSKKLHFTCLMNSDILQLLLCVKKFHQFLCPFSVMYEDVVSQCISVKQTNVLDE